MVSWDKRLHRLRKLRKRSWPTRKRDFGDALVLDSPRLTLKERREILVSLPTLPQRPRHLYAVMQS